MSVINLKKNLAFSTSSQIVTIVASFIANWFLSRYLGPELRGRYVYLFTINSIVWMLMDLGIAKSFAYTLQHSKTDPRKLYSFCLGFFGVFLALSILVFYFALPHLSIFRANSYPKIIMLTLGIYIVSFQLFTRLKFIFIGINKIKEYALLSLLPTVSFMLLLVPTFWLVPTNWRMEYAFLLNVSTLIICIIIFHFRLSNIIKMRWIYNWGTVKESYALGYKAFLSEYLIILMTRIDQLILKHLGNFTKLGVYSLSVNFVDMINTICNMFGVVLLTKFSSISDDKEALVILRKIFVLVNVLNCICIAGMVFLGRFLIIYLYGAAYEGAYWAFLLLIPAVFGLTMGALFNTFLWSRGFPVFTILAPIAPLILKSVFNFIFIPRYSYYGSAVISSVSYILWFVILLIWYFTTHPNQKVYQLIPHKQDFFDAVTMFRQAKEKVVCWISQ